MKYLILVLALMFSSLLIAADIKYIQSDKLRISGFGFIHYDRMMGIEPANKITVEFDLDNVTAILIIDVNATNNKCGDKQKKKLFYLAFPKPEKNVRSIRTAINGPCLIGNEAVLKLRVSTVGEKYYENTITILSAHHYIDGE